MSSRKKLLTYMANDLSDNVRLWLEIVPRPTSTYKTLVSSIKKRPALNIAKKLHRFTHMNSNEMKKILGDAGMLTDKSAAACKKFYETCDICSLSG